jgi:hypothetical protein
MKKEQFNNFINLSIGNSSKLNEVKDRVQSQYAWNGGTCVQLDKLIKDVRDRVVSERLKSDSDNYYIQALLDQKAVLEMSFASNSCADKIETLRQKETGVLITKTSIAQEKSVLGSSKKEENIYIGVGALVLLVGLFIVIKK